MSEGGFKKVNDSDDALYGPRGLLVCGFPPADQEIFLEMLDETGLRALPIIFVVSNQIESTVGELLRLEHKSGYSNFSEMPRAVILSGLTEKELHSIINGYKKLGLPFPLWATLTPASEKWQLNALLLELVKEREAFSSRKKK